MLSTASSCAAASRSPPPPAPTPKPPRPPGPHLSPSTLPSTPRRRRFLCLAAVSPPSPLPAASTQTRCSKWVVVMERPTAPAGGGEVSRAVAVDYYVATLARVLGSDEEAQMRIYDAAWDGSYGFCCEIDEKALSELAKMPGVLTVRPDKGDVSEKDNRRMHLSAATLENFSDVACNHSSSSLKNEFWLVRMEKPGVEVVTKAQMVDNYTQILMKVVGNFPAKMMHKLAYITFHGRGTMVSVVILMKIVQRS